MPVMNLLFKRKSGIRHETFGLDLQDQQPTIATCHIRPIGYGFSFKDLSPQSANPGKQLKRHIRIEKKIYGDEHVWNVLGGNWIPKTFAKAAHIFPLSMGQGSMVYIFGRKAKAEMNTAKNGLWLPIDFDIILRATETNPQAITQLFCPTKDNFKDGKLTNVLLIFALEHFNTAKQYLDQMRYTSVVLQGQTTTFLRRPNLLRQLGDKQYYMLYLSILRKHMEMRQPSRSAFVDACRKVAPTCAAIMAHILSWYDASFKKPSTSSSERHGFTWHKSLADIMLEFRDRDPQRDPQTDANLAERRFL